MPAVWLPSARFPLTSPAVGTSTPGCREFAEARAAALGQSLDEVMNTELEGLGSDASARRRWRQMRALTTEAEAAAEAAAAGPGAAPDAETALMAVARLDPKTTGVFCWHAGWAPCALLLLAQVGSPRQPALVHLPHCGPRPPVAEVMLEEEVREAVISTAGTAAGGRPTAG